MALSGGIIEGAAALIVGAVAAIFVVAKINANADKNTKDIDIIKTMIAENQKSLMALLEKGMSDMRAMIDENKFHQTEALNREISHLKDLINISNSETRSDIQRLELRQNESNQMRERLSLAEASLRSLHKRIDLEPLNLRDKEDK